MSSSLSSPEIPFQSLQEFAKRSTPRIHAQQLGRTGSRHWADQQRWPTWLIAAGITWVASTIFLLFVVARRLQLL